MIGIIAYKEMRMLWRDGRARWIGATLVTLQLLAIASGIRSYKLHAAVRDTAERAQRDQWLHKTAANAHVAAHEGITLFRPVSPLSILDNGTDPFVGTSVYLEPHRRNLFAQPPFETVQRIGRFGELTVALMLQTAIPLVIILLIAPALSAEREQGTFQHLASLGVSVRAIAAGKAIGLGVPALLTVLLPILLGLLVLAARGDVDLTRAGLLLLAYVAYLLIFVIVSISVSAWSRTAQGGLVVLLAFWIITCFLVPRTAFAIAQHYVRAPTAQEFAEELARIDAGVPSFLEQRAAIEKRLLTKYGVPDPRLLPVSTWGVTLYEREIESTRQYNAQFAKLFDAYQLQQRIVDSIGLASPTLAVRTLSMSLATADVAHFRDFAEAAERYRYEMVQGMNQVAVESRMYNSSPKLTDAAGQPAFPEGERAAYERIGPFQYRAPTTIWALSHTRTAAASLVLWLVVTVGVAWAQLGRPHIL